MTRISRNTRRMLALTAVSLGLAAGTGIAAAQYVGPSAVPLTTVKQLQDTGRDDQYATLRGRLLGHLGGDDYTFADDSGQMRVDIDSRHFPAGQPIDDKQLVEITGEFEKDWNKTGFDVEKLTLLR